MASHFWELSVFDEAVDKATSELLPWGADDIALSLEICDQIRSKSVQSRDAMRAIKRRLDHKDPNVQLLALNLTDVCIKNGGDRFLEQIASGEFMDNLVSILKQPALNYEVKSKVLQLVQNWALAFEQKPSLGYVPEVYKSLKSQGFKFPAPDTTAKAKALLATCTAPEWIDADVCLRCRTAFTFTNRRHHCRNCGWVFDQQCSSRTAALPHFGITQEVRVCDSCWTTLKMNKDKDQAQPPEQTKSHSSYSRKDPRRPQSYGATTNDDLRQRATALSLPESQENANRYTDRPGTPAARSEPPPPDPAVKAQAPLATRTAPEWIDSDVCLRCRTAFTFTNRKHHCHNCGQVFDQQCSSRTAALPHLGITQKVRVCDSCWTTIKTNRDKAKDKDKDWVQSPELTKSRSPHSHEDSRSSQRYGDTRIPFPLASLSRARATSPQDSITRVRDIREQRHDDISMKSVDASPDNSIHPDGDLIGSSTSAQDVITALASRGCVDLTPSIDLTACSDLPLAGGGFCDVYRGALHSGSKIAIKVLRVYDRPGADEDSERRKMFKRAARELYHWSKLRHRNVLPLMGLTVFRGHISMISPWMENSSLASYLRLSPGVSRLRLCMDICAGLCYIHANNMVHGDLKAANVMVSSNGIAMIADFGNAQLKDLTLKFSNTTQGGMSVRWAAPELLLADSHPFASKEADVYAYGMTVLETFTGQVPYNGVNDNRVIALVAYERKLPLRPNVDIDDELWNLLTACWSREPSDRPGITEISNRLYTHFSSPLIDLS